MKIEFEKLAEGPNMEAAMEIVARTYVGLPVDTRRFDAAFGWVAKVDGVVVGAAGVAPIWPGRGICWALIGDVPRRAWPAITRHIEAELPKLEAMGFRRLEASVLDGHEAGHRWIKRLGFNSPHKAEAFGPDGASHWLYARLASQPEVRRDEDPSSDVRLPASGAGGAP